MSGTASLERLYRQFSVYPCPQNLSAADVCARPLRSLTLADLVAVEVMSLDDDALRYFFPRLMELMLYTPVFDFRLGDLKQRIPAWQSAEVSAVRQLAEAVWSQLLAAYPAELGYFSDCPSALDLLDWCGLGVPAHLDALLSEEMPAARHLAGLVDAVLSGGRPFETVSVATVSNWLRNPAVGERLRAACSAADAAEATEAARQLSDAYELWSARGR